MRLRINTTHRIDAPYSILIPHHSRKEPASLAEFEIIAIVFCNFGRYAFAAPLPISYRSARNRALEIFPRSTTLIFIYELQPFRRSLAATTIEEILGHHRPNRVGILLFYRYSELSPKANPLSIGI